jgi:hypothetical protein
MSLASRRRYRVSQSQLETRLLKQAIPPEPPRPVQDARYE